MKVKMEIGITLITLIITIIILIILGAVSLYMVLEQGIIDKTIEASQVTKMESYSEQIEFIIYNEIVERSNNKEDKPFIKTLKERIEKNNWISYVLMIDDNDDENEDVQKNNKLIIVTKDNYEFIVKVDNKELKAEIVSKGKTTNQKYEITYLVDGEEEKIEVKKGFSIKLKECDVIKEGYNFLGWCLNQEGTGEIYKAESRYKPEQNVILHAIFGKNIHFDENGGIGEIGDKTVIYGKPIVLSQGTNLRKSGYKFLEWNTRADGSGIAYSDNSQVIIDGSVTTLYAMWKWDNANWQIFWKQNSVNIAEVKNDYYEINTTHWEYSWIEIGTKEMYNLNKVKQIKLTIDCNINRAGNAYLGIISYKDTTPAASTSGMKKAVNISTGTNQTTILNVSDITDSTPYYIVIRLSPSNCKVKNLEFIY